nr:hypothetical protein CFP56_09843 [Quercus suber]
MPLDPREALLASMQWVMMLTNERYSFKNGATPGRRIAISQVIGSTTPLFRLHWTSRLPSAQLLTECLCPECASFCQYERSTNVETRRSSDL